MRLVNLKQIERLLPIINHPNDSFKSMMTHFMFSTKK